MNPVANYCMKMLAAKKHKPLYPDPDPRWTAPMHFWALEDGSTVSFIKTGNAPARVNLISWDGDTWETWDGSAVTLDIGDVLYVKCQADAAVFSTTANYWRFSCTGRVCVGGQLRSIVESANYSDRTRANTKAFCRLFYQNHGLVSAETLRLTQDTVTNNDKYNSMFYECINLRRGPDITIKACTGGNLCLDMFRMCVSLDKPPVIWTQTIGSQAFSGMFYLSGIRRAANLLPTHYPYRACYYMYNGCSNLESLGKMRVRSVNATGTIGGEFHAMYNYCNNLQQTDAFKRIDIVLDRANGDMFNNMFGYTNIVRAPKMKVHVQAETTARTGIFAYAFQYNPYLVDASTIDIDADEIYNGQFGNTFAYCTNLIQAPRIKAKTTNATFSRNSACTTTFYYCTALEDASSIDITADSSNDMRFTTMLGFCKKLIKAPTMDITLSGTQSTNFSGFMNNCSVLEDASSISIKSTVIGTSMFENAFNGCNLLIKAPQINLTGDVATKCYSSMFNSCFKLAEFPKIPLEGEAKESCCNSMFAYCYRMEGAPVTFNITGTHTSFCNSMFRGCIRLKHLPERIFSAAENTYANAWYYMAVDCRALTELPEIMMENNTSSNAFQYAFYNCVSLRYIKTHQKNWTGCLNWVNGVRTALTEIYQPLTVGGVKRTFICPSDAPQTRGANAIPQNWELITFDEQ